MHLHTGSGSSHYLCALVNLGALRATRENHKLRFLIRLMGRINYALPAVDTSLTLPKSPYVTK